MPLNIHAPSLGLGVAIAAISILGVFFVLDFGVSENDNPNAKVKLSDNTEQAKGSDSNNIEMSLFSAKATTLLGSQDATITLVEFGDYQCFYCNRFYHNTESDIVKNYVDTGKVKIIFKDFTIIGQDSVNAAHASHCANEKGRFWEYHDILYNHWTGENNGWASSDNLLEFAKQAGLDETTFSECMSEGRYISVIEQSNSDAKTLGITGTPAFFILRSDNTITRITGAQPYEVFEKIFELKLEK